MRIHPAVWWKSWDWNPSSLWDPVPFQWRLCLHHSLNVFTEQSNGTFAEGAMEAYLNEWIELLI